MLLTKDVGKGYNTIMTNKYTCIKCDSQATNSKQSPGKDERKGTPTHDMSLGSWNCPKCPGKVKVTRSKA